VLSRMREMTRVCHLIKSYVLTYVNDELFFSSTGYECEEFNNPSDFFLDIINGDSSVIDEPEGMFKERSHIPVNFPVIVKTGQVKTATSCNTDRAT
jgi:hypothetical protein